MPNVVKCFSFVILVIFLRILFLLLRLTFSRFLRCAVMFLHVACHRHFYESANSKAAGLRHYNRMKHIYWLNWFKGWIQSNCNQVHRDRCIHLHTATIIEMNWLLQKMKRCMRKEKWRKKRNEHDFKSEPITLLLFVSDCCRFHSWLINGSNT